jgi:hypothetical protein
MMFSSESVFHLLCGTTGLDDGDLIPDISRDFSLRHHLQIGSGAHPASYAMDIEESFGGSAVVACTDHSLHPVPTLRMHGA